MKSHKVCVCVWGGVVQREEEVIVSLVSPEGGGLAVAPPLTPLPHLALFLAQTWPRPRSLPLSPGPHPILPYLQTPSPEEWGGLGVCAGQLHGGRCGRRGRGEEEDPGRSRGGCALPGRAGAPERARGGGEGGSGEGV